ncbi:MAG: shikimate kinase [Archaeoglobaceae archaeon]
MKGRAYAAGTVLNALATGIGSAFPIDLVTEVKVELGGSGVFVNGVARKSRLADEILKHFGVKAGVMVKSEIPTGSGLGSSSAFANALIVAISRALGLKLSAFDVLKLNAELSLRAGVSYTGALDDAAASLLAKFVVTDNSKMRILRLDEVKGYAAVLIPRFGRGRIELEEMRRRSGELEKAVELALRGDYCGAMKLNTSFYCRLIGYPVEIAELGWKSGICCGLSGNGPSFCAFGSKKEMLELKDVWSGFGEVLIRRIPEEPTVPLPS